ncbi:MAG TPA: Crp/Fnr family transcriptional regulator [Pyrinomonadaceae bacterium]|jgi:CRP/FNR family transcriptional regulator
MSIDKVAALRRTTLFRELDQETVRALAARSIERKYQKDELLFVAGDEARGLYVVVEGAVRAFRESTDGREQVIHIEREGATVAEVPVFDDGTYPSTVAAETESTLLFIDKRDVRNLCLEHPQIALAALKVLSGRLRRCAELVEVLSLREVGQRLARFLLGEARARGTRTKDGFEVAMNVTNQQIAARVGSVREVVSRALARLQQDELIVLQGRHLTIPDENALAAYAGEDEG